MRRAAAVLVAALAATFAATLAAPGTAAADPAGPTDYESEIVGIEPAVETISVGIVGGDSFVAIDVEPGTDVVVIGNRGEPYLWIAPDGSVSENRRSPDTYANAERYGVSLAEMPPEVDASAPPEWRQVGDGGSWAWHDHRAHRMEPFPPANVSRGDQVLDAVVPLVVDAVEVDVRITSTWMPAPSRWPAAIGAVVGLVGVGAAVLLHRRATASRPDPGASRPATSRLDLPLLEVPLLAVSAAALVTGAVQFRSLPAATDPRQLWWIAPAVALGAAAIAAVVRRTRPREVTFTLGAVTISAVQLLVWGLERRSGLTRAILPTDAPFWLDRTISAAALSIAVAALLVIVVTVIVTVVSPAAGRRPQRQLTNASGPARSPR